MNEKIEIPYTQPSLIAMFKKELENSAIRFDSYEKLAGVYQESVCSFQFGNQIDYQRSVKILESLKTGATNEYIDEPSKSRILHLFRSKALNDSIIALTIALLSLLLFQMISELTSGSMAKLAWIGVIALIGFIVILILILSRTIHE
ncbi:MAG: hypothetical protein ABR574_06685 [Cryomorphaceae bacterium]|nr:hypothetical protein [Flavobacteriales bacterium]